MDLNKCPKTSSPPKKLPRLTDNAVSKLLKGDFDPNKAHEPLLIGIVRLSRNTKQNNPTKNDDDDDGAHDCSHLRLRYLTCTLFDELHSTIALVALRSEYQWVLEQETAIRTTARALVAAVHGYTYSTANYGVMHPFLCIDSFTVIVQEYDTKTQHHHHQHQQRFNLKQAPKQQGGNVALFLSKLATMLSNADLAGEGAIFDNNPCLKKDTIQSISDFLLHHSAVMTLHFNSSHPRSLSFVVHPQPQHTLNGPTATGTTPSSPASPIVDTTNYTCALAEFASSQQSRQVASLGSNINVEDVHRSRQIEKQYMAALQIALSHAEASPHESLSLQLLQQWHSALCGEGLHPMAGVLRTKNVRAGNTSFVPKQRLVADLKVLFPTLQLLEKRLVHASSDKSAGLDAVTFAAAAFFGVIDVHPFADGNGRLARIVANWALRRAGLPFVINFFATQSQRHEYIRATQITRRNTSLQTHGRTTIDEVLHATRNAGALLPLVDLILDRISKAIIELNKIVMDKLNLANEEAQAKAARQFRERAAAAGTCIICFDNNPNIATLCCGKAVHLNCIAEWLSSQTSCPQCRATLPLMLERGAGRGRRHRGDQTFNHEIISGETRGIPPDPLGRAANIEDTYSDDDGDPSYYDEEDDDFFTTDDTSTVMDDVITSEILWHLHHQYYTSPAICANPSCNNSPAVDCSNGSCARCCLLYGSDHCDRHGRVAT